MDKSTILRLFLQRGAQVDQNALELIAKEPEVLEQILKIEESKLPSVITYDLLKSLSPDTDRNNKEKLSIDQLSKILNERYEFLKSILVGKQELVNLISINKINEKIRQFSIIGLVSEIDDSLILEDPTGQDVFTIYEELAKNLVEDEVIGVVCERHSGLNQVKLVIYPDIPLKKEKNRTERSENCFFISDIHMDSPKFNKNYYKNLIAWLEEQKKLTVFILGGISANKEDIAKLLSDISHPTKLFSEKDIIPVPTIVQIENIQILLSYGTLLERYTKRWELPPDMSITNLVRKRNLNPILTPEFYNNYFLLETTPDILVIGGINKATATNYKGTTIITNGSFDTEPIYWLINLQTRETFKTDFS